MKLNQLFIFLIILVGVSCTPQKTKVDKATDTTNSLSNPTPTPTYGTTSGGWNWGTTSGTTTGTTTSGGTTGTTTGSSGTGGGSTCYGDNRDGDSSGSGSIPLITYYIVKAGRGKSNPPVPANRGEWHSSELGSEVNQVFTSDSRLRVRFKVESQPSSCPDRVTGQSLLPNYTKVKFLVEVQRKLSSGAFESYYWISVPATSVNSCSGIYDIPIATNGPTYIKVYDVRADSACIGGWGQCPAEEIIQSGKCWAMKVQVVNDNTDNFRR